RPARDRGVRRPAAAADPGRLAQGRAVRRARRIIAADRALDRPDRRGERRAGRSTRPGRATLPTLERPRDRAGGRGGRSGAGRRRAALAGLRQLRPVPRLRGTRRDVSPARRRAVVKKGQFESHLLVLITLGLVAFGLVMVYSATSAPAALASTDPMSYLKKQGGYAL